MFVFEFLKGDQAETFGVFNELVLTVFGMIWGEPQILNYKSINHGKFITGYSHWFLLSGH